MESFFEHVHGLLNCLSQGDGMPRGRSFGSPSLHPAREGGRQNNSHFQNPCHLKQTCPKWSTDARVKVRELHVSVSCNELIGTQHVHSNEFLAGCHTSCNGTHTVLTKSAPPNARRDSQPQHGSDLRAPGVTPNFTAATRPTPARSSLDGTPRPTAALRFKNLRALHPMPHETRPPR